jgi:hypothetical protein
LLNAEKQGEEIAPTKLNLPPKFLDVGCPSFRNIEQPSSTNRSIAHDTLTSNISHYFPTDTFLPDISCILPPPPTLADHNPQVRRKYVIEVGWRRGRICNEKRWGVWCIINASV